MILQLVASLLIWWSCSPLHLTNHSAVINKAKRCPCLFTSVDWVAAGTYEVREGWCVWVLLWDGSDSSLAVQPSHREGFPSGAASVAENIPEHTSCNQHEQISRKARRKKLLQDRQPLPNSEHGHASAMAIRTRPGKTCEGPPGWKSVQHRQQIFQNLDFHNREWERLWLESKEIRKSRKPDTTAVASLNGISSGSFALGWMTLTKLCHHAHTALWCWQTSWRESWQHDAKAGPFQLLITIVELCLRLTVNDAASDINVRSGL